MGGVAGAAFAAVLAGVAGNLEADAADEADEAEAADASDTAAGGALDGGGDASGGTVGVVAAGAGIGRGTTETDARWRATGRGGGRTVVGGGGRSAGAGVAGGVGATPAGIIGAGGKITAITTAGASNVVTGCSRPRCNSTTKPACRATIDASVMARRRNGGCSKDAFCTAAGMAAFSSYQLPAPLMMPPPRHTSP